MPRLIKIRDFDFLYRWPWYNVERGKHNKVGYITRENIVIYPLRCGLKKTALSKFRRAHEIISPPPIPLDDNIELFFTKNRDNPHLFISGIKALTTNLAFFNSPIKLPILDRITPEEFFSRWAELTSLLRPGDWILTMDTKSILSRLIALADHGVWSHSATYIGNQRVIEALTSGVVERSVEAYRSPRYRLGLYRPNVTLDITQSKIDFLRAQIGKPYAYRKVLRLVCWKLLKLPATPIMPSPNDTTFLVDAPLIHIV